MWLLPALLFMFSSGHSKQPQRARARTTLATRPVAGLGTINVPTLVCYRAMTLMTPSMRMTSAQSAHAASDQSKQVRLHDTNHADGPLQHVGVGAASVRDRYGAQRRLGCELGRGPSALRRRGQLDGPWRRLPNIDDGYRRRAPVDLVLLSDHSTPWLTLLQVPGML